MLAKDLDLAQERRDLAKIRLASYQGDLKKRYDKNVSRRVLAPGDLVLRKVLGSKKDPTQGKLGANWERPYQIISEAGLGALNLKEMDGRPLKRPWNISNLKKFYQQRKKLKRLYHSKHLYVFTIFLKCKRAFVTYGPWISTYKTESKPQPCQVFCL